MSGQKQSSRLLINEAPLQVLPSLAAAIGLNEAIVLQQIHFLVGLSDASIADDQRWITRSMEAWVREFSWWSLRTVKQIFSNLKKRCLIVTGKFNENKWDHTLWYRIDYEALEAVTPLDIHRTVDSAKSVHSDSAKSVHSEETNPAPSSLLDKIDKRDSLPEVASAPPAVDETVAPKGKPKRPSINQCLKDAIAIHVQGLSPAEGVEMTGLLANKAAAVWQRKLDMPHLTGEHYASIARSIPAFVSWFKDNNSGYSPTSKDPKKFETDYAQFVALNGKSKGASIEDNYIDDPDSPGVKITHAQLETRRRNQAIIEAEYGKAS